MWSTTDGKKEQEQDKALGPSFSRGLPTSRMSRVMMSDVAEPSKLAASTHIWYGVNRARLPGM